MHSLPTKARSHGRTASSDERRRVAVPKPSTRGPLEENIVDDPLQVEQSNTTSTPQRVLSPTLSPTASIADATSDLPAKDFSFLLDPSSYHVLPTNNIPPSFLDAPNIPSVTTPIPELLQTGHYRLAAIAAAKTLVTSTSPNDGPTIFSLLYIRLSCLCLINEHALAAQESKLLGDLTSTFYRHPISHTHLVPWPLRTLSVRLAALGYSEWRKGIMGYYELAHSAREAFARASSLSEKNLWRSRLRECGIRVANVLVEMGELEGAGRHLATLSTSAQSITDAEDESCQETRDIQTMETLVWLRVGDIQAAQRCLSSLTSSSSPTPLINSTLRALIAMSDSDFPTAVSIWQDLRSEYPGDAMVTQNLAVALLYMGRISEARALLSELMDTSPPFHSLVFNLCTIFELCTERHRERKMALAEKLAAGEQAAEREVGWEMGNADFKL
ncbi:hypothetical protein GQ43DRAFT_444690 [Delitschia confertaspora ATCC 74209]|uniref:Tetratricopeptide repeat protein n=1 Tax=Delitschia confertaspora ATCC 74209 TaxID=1513339 RepID=A0A9P4MNB2_9PLEO|nr:hypothetical protein GQ43DRAFT_444690 [Delitschia confertaspora ATCC 74209]